MSETLTTKASINFGIDVPLRVLQRGEPGLKQLAARVEFSITPETSQNIANILAIAIEKDKSSGGIAGLAAPQIGILQRMVVVTAVLQMILRK